MLCGSVRECPRSNDAGKAGPQQRSVTVIGSRPEAGTWSCFCRQGLAGGHGGLISLAKVCEVCGGFFVVTTELLSAESPNS